MTPDFLSYLEKSVLCAVELQPINPLGLSIDEFDEKTRSGYKLNLITGEYYRFRELATLTAIDPNKEPDWRNL